MKKKRRLPEPLWSKYEGKNEKKRPPTRNGKARSSVGSGGMMPCAVWRGKGLGNRKSITGSAEPQEAVLTPSPTLWDGANMSGPGKGHMGWGLMECQPHGPPTASRENGLLMGPS